MLAHSTMDSAISEICPLHRQRSTHLEISYFEIMTHLFCWKNSVHFDSFKTLSCSYRIHSIKNAFDGWWVEYTLFSSDDHLAEIHSSDYLFLTGKFEFDYWSTMLWSFFLSFVGYFAWFQGGQVFLKLKRGEQHSFEAVNQLIDGKCRQIRHRVL